MHDPFSQRFIRLKIISTSLFLVLCLFLCLVLGCGNSDVQEQQARAIYEKAETLRAGGRTLEALQEFARLCDFRDTTIFKKAEAALIKEGLSINDPLESWTVKRMIEVQNTLLRQGKDRHPDGDTIIPYSIQDAWGRLLFVEYSSGDKYSFIVTSAGKDRQFKTPDDLKIYNRYKPGEKKKTLQGDEKDLRSISRQAPRSDMTGTPSPKTAQNTETVVRLKDLLDN